MVAILLAVCSAAAYGTADFLGGFASRGNHVLRVLLTSHTASVVLVVLSLVVFFPGAQLTGRDVGLSLLAGILSLLGLVCLYRGLGGGPMAIVSSVSAVLTAVVPLLIGLVRGERLQALGWLGILLGLLATVLVSLGAGERRHTDPLWLTCMLAVLAGAGLGGMLGVLAQCQPAAGIAPLLLVRCVTVPILAVGVAVLGVREGRLRVLPARPWLPAIAGNLDIGGTMVFMVARPIGSLAVIAVISAQYPLVTVLLARLRLGERLLARQWVGLAAALVAVGLLALRPGA